MEPDLQWLAIAAAGFVAGLLLGMAIWRRRSNSWED